MIRQPKARETDILKAVMDLLAARGFRIFRRNTGAIAAEHKGKRRLVRFSSPGMADLWGWHIGTGRHIEVECKRDGQGATPMQDAWLHAVLADGGVSMLVHSVDECEAELRRWGY